jgi:hypothetical protein
VAAGCEADAWLLLDPEPDPHAGRAIESAAREAAARTWRADIDAKGTEGVRTHE